MKEKIPDDVIWHQSGVNAAGEPFVQLLRGGGVIGQMSPEQARDHARAVLEAAEAAEQDAFLLGFLQTKIGTSFEEAGRVLIEFRAWRVRTTGKQSGPASGWVMPKGKNEAGC